MDTLTREAAVSWISDVIEANAVPEMDLSESVSDKVSKWNDEKLIEVIEYCYEGGFRAFMRDGE